MAKQFLEELNETEKIDFGFSNAVLRKETDFSPVIEKDLKTAYGYFEKNYLVYNNVQAGFHLADYFLHDENYDKAKDYLKESLLTISENEYVSYLKAEIFAKRDIFDFAIVNKIQTEFIFTIFRDTASILNVEWISDEYRKRLESEVETLYDMKLECFGDIIIKKRGIPVDEEKWLRRIRKIIFVYIMLNQKKVITKENIIEFFYSESSLENANSAFHQTLTNIRSIFNFDNKFTNSKITFPFLTCSDKIIQFNPNYFYYVDVVEFEKLYKKAMGYGIPEKEKIKYIEQAIEIYKGKFLEGYYYDWCEKLREKYVSMHLNLLENILEIYTIRNDYKKIIYYSEKILLSDNLNEKAYLDIIKSEVSLGNLAAANKIHIRMIETFNTELKKTPPKDTISKIKLLLKT
jgi:two-component SAPR family response regulator